MIYLGTYVRNSNVESHEFYHDGYLYYHASALQFLGPYGKKKIGDNSPYIECDMFEYELPEELRYINYRTYAERISILCNIIDKMIFENI